MELSKENFRALIFYDFKCGLNENQCMERLTLAFGDEKPSRATIYRWFAEFKRGRVTVTDEPREAKPKTAVTSDNIARVQRMITEDPHCTYSAIQTTLGIGSAAVSKILHEELRMRKIVCRWVPHQLTEFQKSERVRISKETLNLLENGGHRIISKIVTGDETYIPFYDTLTRQESRVWVHEDDPTPTTPKKQRAMKKVMYAVFFRSTGLVKAIKLEEQRTVTANWYINKCLPEVLGSLDIRGLLLHHDNASSHTARATVDYLRENNVRVIEHPPYSPDLAMCDFWLFFNLKKHLRGRKFSSENEIDQAINLYFDSVPKNEWRAAFELWKKRLSRCIEVKGDYFEHL